MHTNKFGLLGRAVTGLAFALGLSGAAMQAQAAATIVIVNGNAAGVGFNDTTAAAPVGGNAGTTLGAQRLIAFQKAAEIWGATLSSDVTIQVLATFEPLNCTASSAVLGSAGARFVFIDVPNEPKPNTLYGQALANKLAGAQQNGNPASNNQDIRARFNSRLGLFADCLPSSPFYLGLDNNHGTKIDLLSVLLHEFGHGLGFQTFTSGATGAQFGGLPSIWDHYLLDTDTNKLWVNMTDAERAASAVKTGKLAWSGAMVNAQVPTSLAARPEVIISGPSAGTSAGKPAFGTASFGPPLGSPSVVSYVMPLSTANALGCNAFSAIDALAVKNNIAIIDRGTCGFAVKTKNAQNAGAKGVIIVNNAAGSAPGLGGTDPTITIPAVSLSLADGSALKTKLLTRSRTASGVLASLGVNLALRAGADAAGRALMYAPNPFESGSSVSHFDTSAFPNALMEPAINGDLSHIVVLPDLTFKLLQEIGW